MDYGVDPKKTVTLKCECGAKYQTKASAPIVGACPSCRAKLLADFWAAWEKDNES